MTDDRRTCILDAAKRLLGRYGPQKTTIADIAREAGVGVGTVYLEFASKEAIVEELSARRYQAVLDSMRRAAARSEDPAERLRGVLDARAFGFLSPSDEGVHARDLLHCTVAAVKVVHHRFQEEERALLAALLAEAARSGAFDVEEPAATAAVVLRAYVSFSPPWVFGQPRDELTRALARMHDLVLRGLLRRERVPR